MQYKLKYQASFYLKYIPTYPSENWQQPVLERVNGTLERA